MFTPPCQIPETEDFDRAVKITWSLFEVGRLVSNPRIVEIYPEVSFWTMNGRRPLDAAAAAWSAWRVAHGQAGSLPDPPEVGLAGRAVAIRY